MTTSKDPITWEQSKRYIKTGELYKLIRSPEITAKYRRHKSQLESKGQDLVSFILTSRLHWDVKELNHFNNIAFASDEDKIKALFKDKTTLKILTNDYPYNLEDSISHILIWSKIYIPLYQSNVNASTDDSVVMQSMNTEVKQLIEKFLDHLLKPLGLTDYIWFINYPRLQSIKTVSHIHVLIKSNDKDTVQRLVDDESLLTPLPSE
ncbi:hypothetical protein KDRO_E01050 [Kluyveromyces lactis]|nr:hypothetical protein KDRO_E01050 [Kluyveromyces lactis]